MKDMKIMKGRGKRRGLILNFLKLQVLHALHGEKVLCFLRKEVSLQRFRGFLTQNPEPRTQNVERRTLNLI